MPTKTAPSTTPTQQTPLAPILKRWERFVRALPSPKLSPTLERRYVGLVHQQRQRDRLRQMALSARAPLGSDLRRILKLPNSGIQMSLEDRWSIVGMTGCGKSTVAEKIAQTYRQYYPEARLYILDTTMDSRFDGARELVEGMAAPLVEPGKVAIWRPDDNDIPTYDAWFGDILKQRGPSIVWIDELASIGRGTAQSYPNNFALLLKQGRKHGKMVLTLTQDAAYIPRQVLGQAWHVVRMRLISESDVGKLDKLLHGAIDPRREPTTRYGLWYKRLNRPDVARHFADWRALLS